VKLSRLAALITVVLLAGGCTDAGPSHPRTAEAETGDTATLPNAASGSAPTFGSGGGTTVRARQSTGRPTARVSAAVVGWRLPTPVGREVAIPTPDGVVVAGGLLDGDRSTARAYRIDLRSGRRTTLADLRIPVHDAAGALLDGHPVVVGGGNDTGERSEVQELDPMRGWAVVGRLPHPRSDLVAVTVDGRVVVLGGYDGSGSPKDIVMLSATGRPSIVGTLDIGVRYSAVAVADGALWLFGGEHDAHLVTAIQRIDTRSWRTRVVGHLERPLTHAAAVVLDGDILLAGGRLRVGSVTSQVWRFDPESSMLNRAGRLPYPVADAAVATAHGAAYVLGGETPAMSKRVIRLRVRP
jgi:hypothetical protein